MNLEKRFSLAIFDMDGVLVDSEKAFKHACQDALLQWGVHAEREEFVPYTGMGDILYIGGVSEAHGVPSLYYGDEAGVEGGRDPFCRRTYPWGREDKELIEHYKKLGALRKDPIFAEGNFKVIDSGVGYIIYERSLGERKITVFSNVSGMDMETDIRGRDMMSGEEFDGIVPALSTVVIE